MREGLFLFRAWILAFILFSAIGCFSSSVLLKQIYCPYVRNDNIVRSVHVKLIERNGHDRDWTFGFFVTAANEKSFTGAANVRHVTQPTLSCQMMYLEDLLGTKLFESDSHPLRLTDDWLPLKRRAEEILEMVERVGEKLSSAEEQVEGVVSIGCGKLASEKILADRIAGFKRECPRVVFRNPYGRCRSDESAYG